MAILAGGVAHEFNNLLAAISGCVQMFSEIIQADDEPSQENVGNALKAAKCAAELTTVSSPSAEDR